MKTRLLLCLAVIGTLSAFKNADSRLTARPHRSAIARENGHLLLHRPANAVKGGKIALPQDVPHARKVSSAALDSVTQLLRLKLYIDQYNYDDIAIAFNGGASPAYNPNEDSKYLQGIGAAEGLSCFSSDGVQLSVDFLPLPKQAPDVIRLNIQAQNSGPITLKRTQLDALPKNYSVWLVDNYKKDSIDLRVDSNYAFAINKSDLASFGPRRFKVVISKTQPLPFQLVDFNAAKASGGAEITWSTQNEGDDTHFAVERSSDDGSIFNVLDSLVSSSKGSYSFTDADPPTSSNQYRVKVTDATGVISYSNVVTLLYSVSAPAVTNAISVYPNPTNGMINLSINQTNGSGSNLAVQSFGASSASANTTAGNTSYNIRIVNISGATIKSAVSSSGSWQDNVSNLSAGTYIITVIDNGTSKMVGRSTFVKL